MSRNRLRSVSAVNSDPIAPIAVALRRRRLQLGITLARLSESTGLPVNVLNNIDAGNRDIDVTTLITLCDVLRMEPTELILEAEAIQDRIYSNKFMSQSLRTQKQLERMERQHLLVCGQLLRLSKQIHMLKMQSIKMQSRKLNSKPAVGRSQGPDLLEAAVVSHIEKMSESAEQLRRTRQWCEETERFYFRQNSTCSG